MKTLENHLILFDAECPLCKVYTQAFVNTGMLDQNGRAAYQEIAYETCPMVDRQRAVNEIALVNQETGEVSYGIESLFKIFGNVMPVFKPLFGFGPFVWLMRKVYGLFSYNRRVIIPVDVNSKELQPSFKLHYRLVYLMLAWLVVSAILTRYTPLLSQFVPVGNAWREYLICGGQLIFQGIIISLYDSKKLWAYLGNMMTISFGGALLLLLMVLLQHLTAMHPIINLVWFGIVVGLMFLEHIRRSNLLHLGWWMTISWALYRVLVLLIILKA